jgi:Mg2+ and Co2+ transporter CorA
VEFINFLSNPRACEREPWVKVRWINVGGISWDVIRALALKYDLHPLSLEDVLHLPGSLRSGVDYYKRHLFIRVLSHTVNKSGQAQPNFLEQAPRSSSPEPFKDADPIDGLPTYSVEVPPSSGFASRFSRKFRTPHKSGTIEPGGYDVENVNASKPPQSAHAGNYGSFYATYDQGQAVNKTVLKLMQELKDGGRVEVNIKPVSIFLFKDGTVISIHPDNDLKFTEPIRRRLMQRDTGLRTTADASFLVHGLLDLVVDSALEIVDTYQRKIIDLEQQILLKPKMKAVRQLHIISGDLILHKRTLTPIKTLVYGLRRYDLDRSVALYNQDDQVKAKIEGYMSHKTTIYLADVHDHMEYILTSIEMFASISENLINFSFNMSSHEMNEVMRTLTIVTVLFVPLTLLTGYFGMNFDPMWSVQKNSDLLFWKIAIPMMIAIVTIFFWSEFGRMYERLEKRLQRKKIDKLKQD